MKKNYISFLIILTLCFGLNSQAQTEWTGPTTTFSKAAFADWTLPANQDQLTPNVILTRANIRGIFNIAQEVSYDQATNVSPLDTEWAYGTIAEGVGTLTFDTWYNTVSANPPSMVGLDMVVHLITDDIYVDLKFTAWGIGGGAGGSFTYERSTDQGLSLDNNEISGFKLYPNPAKDFISVSGTKGTMQFDVYNMLGSKIHSGILSNDNQRINLRNLSAGVYMLKLDNGNTFKFIKE